MHTRILTTILLLTAATLSGCCSCHEHSNDRHFPSTVISYSSGGGITGLSTGFTITAERAVLKWSGTPTEKKQIDTVGIVPKRRYYGMLKEIYSLSPDTVRQMETGNMTTALVITSGDVRYVYQWAGLYYSDDAVPETVTPLRNAIWDVLKEYYGKERE